MSKSLGNYIAINDAPNEIFGKVMSISDHLMWRYFELLSFKGIDAINEMREGVQNGQNPRDVKIELACELVARFHSRSAADAAREAFINRFSRGQTPVDIPEVQLKSDGTAILISVAMKTALLAASTSEARRLIGQGAVRINGERVDDVNAVLSPGSVSTLEVGKRRIALISVI